MVQEKRFGSVHTVLRSSQHGYPTFTESVVNVRHDGIEGDAHSGALRESFTKPGTLKPNDRPISIVAKEVIDEMRSKFGLARTMKPGGFNEQLVVEGLGDLSDAEPGDIISFGGGVTLEVVEGAMPCDRLNQFHGESSLSRVLVEKQPDGKIRTKRGALTKVLTPGILMPGESVTISPSQKTSI